MDNIAKKKEKKKKSKNDFLEILTFEFTLKKNYKNLRIFIVILE